MKVPELERPTVHWFNEVAGFPVMTEEEKVRRVTLSTPRRDRIAIYVAIGSALVSVIAILISLYK